MTKEEFILFIEILGFTQTWGSDSNAFSLSTDVIGKPNQNYMAFADQLKISLGEKGLVQLSLSQMSTHIMSGKSFGNFHLSTFGDDGDFQLELFLSFILGSFNKKPSHIVQFMRDMRIKNILK
jgi:hypothetical protein